jgi:hypothetical protein
MSCLRASTAVLALFWAAVEIVRLGVLVVYAVYFTIDLDVYWNRNILLEILLSACAVAYYLTVGIPVQGDAWQMPHGFAYLATALGLTLLGLFAVRANEIRTTCSLCPSSLAGDCTSNPFSAGDTLDWTKRATYDRDVVLNATLASNPSSRLAHDPVLDLLPDCWAIGCTDCHDTYVWRFPTMLLTFVDGAVNTAFGFALVCITRAVDR